MKRTIIISAMLVIFSCTIFGQEKNFTPDDFKPYIDTQIGIILKDNALSDESVSETFYLREVNDRYIVCSYYKNTDKYQIYILINEIACVILKHEESEE